MRERLSKSVHTRKFGARPEPDRGDLSIPGSIDTQCPATVLVSAYFANARKRLMSTKPIRVLAVDDHSLLRDGIAMLLALNPIWNSSQSVQRREAIEQFRIHNRM